MYHSPLFFLTCTVRSSASDRWFSPNSQLYSSMIFLVDELASLLVNSSTYFINFSNLLYSFFVSLMNEPCCGRATPSMFLGEWKLRMFSSARHRR